MPGIVGIVSQRPAEECESVVKAMLASMKHEASYVSGMYSASEMGIYAGWVAHENSFAAAQVFFNEQRDIALIFSGECFVDRETRADLRQNGHTFGENKGDWLVHFYEKEGVRFFEKLNGLFSGLLIDKRQEKAFLFNDRYGVERIYWHEADGEFYFASEAKALLRVLPELREFDADGVAQFLAFGCTLQGRTLFRGIDILPVGSLWSFEDGQCRKGRYFSPETWEAQSALSAESYEAEFEKTFKRILPRYFASESKIGISLTAGLDGRMIMACRPEGGEAPICYTFCGQDRSTLDVRLAAKVAAACGLEHQILRIGQDFFSDFASHADRTVYITDGTLGPLGAHEIYMNRKASRLSPVRLTGVFGGEVFRGVSTFNPLDLSRRLVNPDFHQSSVSCRQEEVFHNQRSSPREAFYEISVKRFGTPAASRSQLCFRTPYLDNELVALAFRIPEAIRTSPLPAVRLVTNNSPLLGSIRTDMGQMGEAGELTDIARRLFSRVTFKLDYLYNEGLPHWASPFESPFHSIASKLRIIGQHKYLRYRRWFRRELAEYVKERLTDRRTLESSFWNSHFLEEMTADHTAGRKNYTFEIDAVLTLEAVERLLLCNVPRQTMPVMACVVSG
jgi:asparagine synthase (glutamine-hydrolysing)